MYSCIQKKTEAANKSFSMFEDNDRILVALSGGADSVALLLSLKEYYPCLKLYACHVNHMLRGSEADRDMNFVKDLCRNNSIPLEVLSTDVAAYAFEQGLSTELAARNIRYAYFEEVCRKHGINKVATAHTLSDNAETVLFNLTRGSGLQGLCGIPGKRPLCEGIDIIRPLIYVPREEIEEYLASKNQTFVTDSTNLTDDYTRNYFRHNIIPLLKRINPSFEESLGKTCASLTQTQLFVNKTTEINFTNDIKKIAPLDDCILSGIIIKLYNKASGKTLLEKVHIDKIISLVRKSYTDGFKRTYEICLPDKLSCIIKNDALEFAPTVRQRNIYNTEYICEIKTGLTIIDNTEFAVYVSDDITSIPEGYSVYSTDIIDKSKISGKLFARNRKSGDVIRQGEMTKKVKDLFIHNKISTETRNVIPFICDDAGIVCIPGVAKNDSHKTTAYNKENQLYIYTLTRTTK